MMRIVHVSASDLGGGAARAAYRVHRALVEAGVDSRFLVGQKYSADPTVTEIFPLRGSTLRRRVHENLDQLPLRFYPRRPAEIFSLNWAPNGAARAIAALQPSVVHLHWVNQGLLPIRHLRHLGAPLVWNMCDEWPFTGGCHYTGECTRYQQGCGNCPALASSSAGDVSARTLAAKQRAWAGVSLEVVAPSRWLAERSRASALFAQRTCTIIPTGVDTRIFRPIPAAQARSLLGLKPEGMIVMFGAIQPGEQRKGFDLAEAALARLSASGGATDITLCTFGDWPHGAPERVGKIPLHHLGRLGDELSVALAFSAADVALIPSRADAGPQTTVEALACGTPVVGFPVGVTADLVRHRENGFLAAAFSSEQLADGLRWAAEVRGDPTVRAAARRAAVESADLPSQVPLYLEIYRRAIAGGRTR